MVGVPDNVMRLAEFTSHSFKPQLFEPADTVEGLIPYSTRDMSTQDDRPHRTLVFCLGGSGVG